MQTSARGLGVAAAVCLLVACGGRGSSDDGGPGDGGPSPTGPIVFRSCDPVMVDMGPPPDLGTPPECFGVPTMDCATRPVAGCTMGLGCVVTQCRGFPVSCDSLNMTDCGTQVGCHWSGSACAGTGDACTTFTAMAACGAQLGCVWSATMSCGGVTTPCGMLDAAHCGTQPGCTTTNPDAGVMRDAGLPACTGCAGTAPFDVRVTKGPEPLMPFAGVAVHLETTCGASMDVTTGADGRAHADLDRTRGSWTMTAAAAGYAAVSVVGISDFELDGDVRLDPITTPTATMIGATGMVTGVAPSDMVRVDAYDFDTTTAGAGGTWTSSYYLEPWPVPLRFCATTLDPMMRATNEVCSPETTRGATPVAGLTLALPSPAAVPTESSVVVTLPAGGLLPASTAMLDSVLAEHGLALQGDPYVFVGSAAWDDPTKTVSIRSFDALPVNVVPVSFLGAAARVNVIVHAPFPATIAVPQADVLAVSGTALADSTATASGSGWDVLAWHLGEDETGALAKWRVFAPLNGAMPVTVGVPHLPTSVHASDLGLTGPTESIALLVQMHEGRIWTTRVNNGPVRQYAASLGGSYAPLDSSGR